MPLLFARNLPSYGTRRIPAAAAEKGTGEIAFAVIAITLTIVAVFIRWHLPPGKSAGSSRSLASLWPSPC